MTALQIALGLLYGFGCMLAGIAFAKLGQRIMGDTYSRGWALRDRLATEDAVREAAATEVALSSLREHIHGLVMDVNGLRDLLAAERGLHVGGISVRHLPVDPEWVKENTYVLSLELTPKFTDEMHLQVMLGILAVRARTGLGLPALKPGGARFAMS